MAVNAQTLTVASGVLTLTGSPTGAGVYAIVCAPDEVITSIVGGSDHALITLHPLSTSDFFVLHDNGTTIRLREGLGFAPQTIYDRITLRLAEDGTTWVEEITRAHF